MKHFYINNGDLYSSEVPIVCSVFSEISKEEYEEKLKVAREESDAIMRETVRNARLKEETIIREARDEASLILKRADEQIEMERRQAVNDIKNDVSGMAVDIAGAVLGRNIKPEEHSELIDSFIDNFGEEK